MANSHVKDALLEVDSTLLSSVHEHLKIDVDSTEHPAKDHAELEKKVRMRKRISRRSPWSSNNRNRLPRTNHRDMRQSDEFHRQENYGGRDTINSTVEDFGHSAREESRTHCSKGSITSLLETDDNVECLAAASSDLVQKEKKSFGLCKYGHAASLPAVDDVSIDKISAQFSEKRPPAFVKGVWESTVKSLSHEEKSSDLASTCDPPLKQMEEKNYKFEHELEQAIEKSSVYKQKTIEVTLADRKSQRKHPSCDLDATKHACLAVLKKEDNLLEISHPSPERQLVACLKKKLLVLDLNGLLADIVSPPPKECKADTNISRRAVFRRPFCNDFLMFCFERFNVGIWSSRTKKIIDRVVDYLLGDMKYKLLFCWDISHCTGTGFRTLENKHKEVVFKELRKIWEKHDINLPWEKGDYNESNTLLLDDSPYKALLNPMHTAIFPYSYNFKDRSDNSLGPEGDLRVYLQDLATAEDLQKYVEEHPFGQGAIDETSSSWAYYRKVISSHSLVPSKIY